MRRPVAFVSLTLTILIAACSGNESTAPSTQNDPVVAPTGVVPPSFATASNGEGLSITTDKDDYAPGDTVWFTGAGWQAGDTLDIVLTDEPQTHEPHRWTILVAGDGTFRDSTYVVDEGDLDVRFTLTASSRANPAQTLAVQFTDGNLQQVQLAPASLTVARGTNAMYTATVVMGGNTNNCTITLSVTTALPAGATATFSTPNPFTTTNVNVSRTLTIATTAATPPGSYPFTVQATRGANCQGNGNPTVNGTLVVNAITSTTVVSSLNPSLTGQAVTFTATVTAGNPVNAAGSVTFREGASCATGTVLSGPTTLSASGEAAFSTSSLAVGGHTIWACYSGTVPPDGGYLESTGSVEQQVNAPSNAAPVLHEIGPRSVNEEALLTFTADATDNPAQTLTFSLSNGSAGSVPAGASIVSGTGVFTWTPTEAQGPGSYTFDVCVADNGSPPLSDCETITVTVDEVNKPPVLDVIGPQTVDEETPLTFTATATDPDILAGGAKNALSFSLVAGTHPVPAGAAITSAGAFSWTPTEAQGPGVYKFKVKVTDDGAPNLSDDQEITVTVNEVNKPPVLDPIGSQIVNEGSLLTFTATASDPDILAGGAKNTLTFSLRNASHADLGTAAINGMSGVFTWTPADDNPSVTPFDDHTITVVVTDDGDNPADLSADETIGIRVNNVAPTISAITLDPNTAGYVYPLTGQPKVMATWTDPGVQDTHTCTYGIKDEVLGTFVSTGLACGAPMNVGAAGLYTVTVTVTDDDTGSDTKTFPTGGLLIVIYDPSAGFVTGGGWINSPPGACRFGACQEGTVGKATFGFVSKYQKGAVTPTGNTEFQFHAGNLNFKSQSYEWLVVNGNSGRAQYKGVGIVNGGGNYGFMLTAYDGATNRFRIKIWDVGTSAVIYDNQMDQPDTSTLATELGGGNIIIHVPKK
jgi:hypothetical protein